VKANGGHIFHYHGDWHEEIGSKGAGTGSGGKYKCDVNCETPIK